MRVWKIEFKPLGRKIVNIIMKHKLTVLLFIISYVSIVASAVDIKDENLTYDVMFKWGLINKKAGEVKIETMNTSGGKFSSTLVGKSAKWADRFYMVRDTLMGTIKKDENLYPLSYQKISHEGGEFKRDIISYTRNEDEVTATCDRYHRKKPDKPVVHSQRLLKANGYTLDMLSAFYYMRYLNYPAMKNGDSETMNIFSGKRKEILTITYRGMEPVNLNGIVHNCYKITFTFTSDGKKKTSDDLEAWISTEVTRIPYKLQGKLPVGTIKCFYVQ